MKSERPTQNSKHQNAFTAGAAAPSSAAISAAAFVFTLADENFIDKKKRLFC